MKDRLSGYRDAMDRSVFKEGKFTTRHKQEVFVKIKQRTRKRNDWFPRMMSLSFVIVFLLIGVYFITDMISTPADQAESPPQAEPAVTENGTAPLPIDGEGVNKDEERPAPYEEWLQEYPYKEIKKHFENYELPQEGRVADSQFINGITYENGYTFDSRTKAMMAREHSETGPAAPTEGQKTGVIMGLLSDAAAMEEPGDRTSSNASSQVDLPLSRLKEIRELNDFEPLEAWLAETEEILNKVDTSESWEGNKRYYSEAYQRLQEMKSLIEGKE
ncbi:hypothetical protein [Sporosarcina trichiuri]|uniref:hypothetical protein n=1 Tax=Sporosarcina trichiuri TaxID=3056445 RepID=UPI0025B3F08C|nr:hypothetical protein [Sporosarcina sp. 0.2-SM1T-5]WJY27544.1 hypothetical protein QWT68_00540 [Sporosarcina sp. 0.2-SM1T-5]